MKLSQFAYMFLALLLANLIAWSTHAEVEGNISLQSSFDSHSAFEPPSTFDSLSAIVAYTSTASSSSNPFSLDSDTLPTNDSTRQVMRIGSVEGSGTDFKPQLEFERLVVPPSPEVSDMLRHLDEDMDYSAGAATITVPLYSWQSGDITINLAMRYRTGAFRVDDRAGWTGLGWDLQGGGVIARSIAGMPDENIKLKIRSANAVRTDSTIKYFEDLHRQECAAELDRYSWNCPAGSGSFVINNGKIIQTPATNNKIELYGDIKDKVRDFSITSPDGTQYIFTVREYVDVQHTPPSERPEPCYRSSNYSNAVSSWHLSKITAPSGECATFLYDSISDWRRTENPYIGTYSLHIKQDGARLPDPKYTSTHDLGSQLRTITTFHKQRFLKKIETRTAIAEFISANDRGSVDDVPRRLSSIRIYPPEKSDVRNISFTHHEPTNSQMKLNKIKIESENQLLDYHEFSYESSGYALSADFFGFPNRESNNTRPTIINLQTGKYNHSFDPDKDEVKSGTLIMHRNALGLETSYEYEPAECSYQSQRYDNDTTYNYSIGVRLKKIIDKDRVTGRKRIRSFQYSAPQTDIGFDDVYPDAFTSISGFVDKVWLGGFLMANDPYCSVSFYSRSRLSGFPINRASVKYGEVTELISGTIPGIRYNSDTIPIKRVMKYNLTDCKLDFIPSIPHHFEFDRDRMAARDLNVGYSPRGFSNTVTRNNYIRGTFAEKLGSAPLLIEKTEYEYRDGNYQPLITQKYHYTKKDSATIQTGFYYEPGTCDRKYPYTFTCDSYKIIHDWKYTTDFTYGDVLLTHFNTVVDSIHTTRYFPSGATQTSTRKILFSSPESALIVIPRLSVKYPDAYLNSDGINPFPTDTLKILLGENENNIRTPLGEIIRENGHKLEHYTARVLNIRNRNLSPWNDTKQLDLPVAEMWVVDGRDTILKKIEYAKFSSTLLPVRSELFASSVNKARSRLALQRITGYSTHGHPTGIEQIGQPYSSVSYFSDGKLADYPSSIKIGDASVTASSLTQSLTHTTSFAYKPLVGCTSVTAPDGSTTEYGYLGGRLVSKSDAEGGDLQKWSYSLFGEDASAGDGHGYSNYTYKGFNTIIEKSVPDATPGTAWDETKASEKRQYYDGYGLPVISVQKGFGNVSGILSTNTINSLNPSPVCDVIQVTRRDALHREEKVWNPMGWEEDIEELFSQSSSDTNNLFWSDTPLASKSQSIWNDEKGYIKNTYPISVEEQPSSTALQGDSFSQHPTKTEYVCSRTDVAKYKVVKLSFDGTNLKGNGFYEDGELDCTHVTDGNGAETLTFSDFMGRTVLMRKSAEGGGYSDTYSVYDSWGRPLIFLPPECSARIVSSTMNRPVSDKTISDFAYIYTYDNKLRLKSKKLPGCKPLRYVYDSENRVVFTQDGNLADASKMRFCFYDKLGREAVSGICNDISSIWTLTDNEISAKGFVSRNAKIGEGFLKTGYQLPIGINLRDSSRPRVGIGSGNLGGSLLDGTDSGSLTIISLSSCELQTAYYYDNYHFIPSGFQSVKELVLEEGEEVDESEGILPAYCYMNPPIGSLTGTLSSVSGDDEEVTLACEQAGYSRTGYGGRVLSIMGYKPGGILYLEEKSYPNGFTSLREITPSSAGLPLSEKKTVYTHLGEKSEETTVYEYDRYGRPLRITEGGAELQACSYDANGALKEVKYLGGFKREEEHDIRGASKGWSLYSGVSSTSTLGVVPLPRTILSQTLSYGNESAYTDWVGRITGKTTDMPYSVGVFHPYGKDYKNRYDYKYNIAGFLRIASFQDFNDDEADYYAGYSYDRQANIKYESRYGPTIWDTYGPVYRVTISRDGHKIKYVSPDDLDEYPSENQPLVLNPETLYTYDSNGNQTNDPSRDIESIEWDWNDKPIKITFGNGESISYRYTSLGERFSEEYHTGQDYRRTLICGHEYIDWQLDRVLANGYYTDKDGTRHLYIPDYQGNVLAVVNTSTGKIEQFTDYYPYGMPHATAYAPEKNRRKFGAKELTTEGGAYLANFEARLYSPFIGNFLSPDINAEDYLDISPWAFCGGDPINYIDPTGNDLTVHGRNNSSVTVTTDLINLSVDASALGVNWGGNYTLQGDELLSAALDIVGCIDPTGLADGLNTFLQAQKGDYGGAVLSAIGLVPYVGDTAKAGKIGKDVKIISEGVDAAKSGAKKIHGNSKNSTKAQHLYEIFEKDTGRTVKTGISGGKKTKVGKSQRANKQVNKWNKEAGYDKFDSRIVKDIPAGPKAREEALKAEKNNADRLRKQNELDKKFHQRP